MPEITGKHRCRCQWNARRIPYISEVDLQGSKNFLAKRGIGGKPEKKVERVVDCGAGIGRITEGLLLGIAGKVDIVEPIAKFSENLKGKAGIGEIFNVGLEDWPPRESEDLKYDLIWNQWCWGHLTDAQLTTYLEKCQKVLETDGLIIVKENMSTSGGDVFDEVDSSLTRCDQKLRDIFERAGLKIKKTEIQKGLPKELYPVRTYALVPQSEDTGMLDVSNIVLARMRVPGCETLRLSCENGFLSLGSKNLVFRLGMKPCEPCATGVRSM